MSKTRKVRKSVLTIRLSEDELAAIRQAAEHNGKSVSEWVRELATGKAYLPRITVNGTPIP